MLDTHFLLFSFFFGLRMWQVWRTAVLVCQTFLMCCLVKVCATLSLGNVIVWYQTKYPLILNFSFVDFRKQFCMQLHKVLYQWMHVQSNVR